jgi:DNA helicase-4
MTLLEVFQPTILHRLVSRCARHTALSVSYHYFVIATPGKSRSIPYSEITGFHKETFLFWSKIKIIINKGSDVPFGWMQKSRTRQFLETIENLVSESAKFYRTIDQAREWVTSFDRWYSVATSGTRWLAFSDLTGVLRDHQERLGGLWETALADLPLNRENLRKHLKAVHEVIGDPDAFRARCNRRFEVDELERMSSFFDRTLGTPLTEEQRKAVIVDEDAELVIAAAGSGKSTTIKAKVAYLIQKQLAEPNQIQVIAFNKNVQQELQKSLTRNFPSININTFHSFGLRIVSEARGASPGVSELAESRESLAGFIDSILERLFEKHPEDLTEFFVSYAKAYRDKFDFKNLGEYLSYIRSAGLLTLQGETVKSLEELEIANFLYASGIKYEYEKEYEYDVATVRHRQYKPDFYLPDYGIYIEHFALDAAGHTPAFIDEEEYIASRRWKIETHGSYKTLLIETFSHEKRSGKLASNLLSKLESHGVAPNPRNPKELLETLNTKGYISELGILVATFLNLYKGSGLTFLELVRKVPPSGLEGLRAKKFLDIFGNVFEEYEWELEASGSVDFNDMINIAAETLESGVEIKCLKDIKYVLIDEFQDISSNRANLVKKIFETGRGVKLMAVGDDWQSIYRFSGSDIGVMTAFGEYFGRYEVRQLSQTFRFTDSTERVASRFVLKNDAQIRKNVVARDSLGKKSVILWNPKLGEGSILQSIASRISPAKSRKQTVLVLGRYNFYRDQLGIAELNEQRPDLILKFSTVHSAKGSEADYVVIVGVKCGRYAFPSEIADDPLLDMVLSSKEHFEHAEERRLFYVALTRSKNDVYVVGDFSSPSPFFSELLDDPDVNRDYLGSAVNRRCKECDAVMVEREGKFGLFFGCSNFPLCTSVSRPCLACGRGFLVRKDFHAECDNSACRNDYEVCPECETGLLVKRSGRYGAFLGCTNFSVSECDYTRNLRA